MRSRRRERRDGWRIRRYPGHANASATGGGRLEAGGTATGDYRSRRSDRSVLGCTGCVRVQSGWGGWPARPRTPRSASGTFRARPARRCSRPRPTARRRAPAALRARIRTTPRASSCSARSAIGAAASEIGSRAARATCSRSPTRRAPADRAGPRLPSGRPSTSASATMPSCMTSARWLSRAMPAPERHRHTQVLPQPLAAVAELLDRRRRARTRRSPRARRA